MIETFLAALSNVRMRGLEPMVVLVTEEDRGILREDLLAHPGYHGYQSRGQDFMIHGVMVTRCDAAVRPLFLDGIGRTVGDIEVLGHLDRLRGFLDVERNATATLQAEIDRLTGSRWRRLLTWLGVWR